MRCYLSKGRAACLCLLTILALLTLSPAQATEQTAATQGVQIDLIGDSLAQGLWVGLAHKFRADKSVTIVDHSQIGTGIARDDILDWTQEVEKIVKDKPVKLAAIMIGGNDGQPIRIEGQKYREKVGTDLWKQTYGDRVERIMTVLKDSGAGVYWVGLPVQRDAARNQIGQMINDIVRERATKTGVTFVDIYPLSADANGLYAAYLPDSTGHKRLMRNPDGLHFTADGWFAVSDFLVGKFTKSEAAAVLINAGTSKAAP